MIKKLSICVRRDITALDMDDRLKKVNPFNIDTDLREDKEGSFVRGRS